MTAKQDADFSAGRATDDRGEPVTLGEFKGVEIYPMPMFATLAVDDVNAAAAWYERALGFITVFRAPGPGGLVHLRRRKYQDVLLMPGQAGAAPPTTVTLSFSADGEVDALAAQARSVDASGASAVEGPVDTGWNTRDLRVTDPAGHRLIFTARNPNPDPEQVRRWQKIFADQSKGQS